MIKGKLTYKKLADWVNQQFAKLEITGYEVYKVERTNFRAVDYEGGACKLKVRFKDKSLPKDHLIQGSNYFMCFYFLGEYEQYLKDGYELYLKYSNSRLQLLRDLEIEVRKK